jgi:hypothetical protein
MLRKSLFWGLTLVLVVALVNLVIRGRRLEKQRAEQLVEVVQESKPTATRVLNPQELEIVQPKTSIENKSRTAHHQVEIRNSGTLPFSEIRLKISYLDKNGKELDKTFYSLPGTIPPGAAVKLNEIVIDKIPAVAADARISIAFADIGKSSATTK